MWKAWIFLTSFEHSSKVQHRSQAVWWPITPTVAGIGKFSIPRGSLAPQSTRGTKFSAQIVPFFQICEFGSVLKVMLLYKAYTSVSELNFWTIRQVSCNPGWVRSNQVWNSNWSRISQLFKQEKIAPRGPCPFQYNVSKRDLDRTESRLVHQRWRHWCSGWNRRLQQSVLVRCSAHLRH